MIALFVIVAALALVVGLVLGSWLWFVLVEAWHEASRIIRMIPLDALVRGVRAEMSRERETRRMLVGKRVL
jgi:small basic protein